MRFFNICVFMLYVILFLSWELVGSGREVDRVFIVRFGI